MRTVELARRGGVLGGVCTRLACLAAAVALGGTVVGGDDAGKAARQKILQERILDHFCIGIEAPIEWMNETRDKFGAKWDIRTAYFSGGADKEPPAARSWDFVFWDNKWENPKKERGVWARKWVASSPRPARLSRTAAWPARAKRAANTPSSLCSSKRSGVASSAAAEGVGARRSAAKSSRVTSVS